MTESIVAPGEFQLDPRLVARISARVAGTAAQVRAKRGDAVKAGDLLAVVDSVEVGRLKAEWLRTVVQARLKENALQNVERAAGAATEQKRRDAEAALRDAEVRMAAAEQALVNLRLRPSPEDKEKRDPERLAERMRRLGLPPEIPDQGSANLLPVVSPQDGILLSTDVVSGERVEPNHTLFVVADTRRLFAILYIMTGDSVRVQVGQSVRFRPDGSDDDALGKVISIAPSADESTRRLTVRVEVDNPKGSLRASTLGRGRILIRSIPTAVVVPKTAIAEIDGWPVTFIRDRTFLREGGRAAFHVRPVHVGVQDGEQVEILAGLVPGEIVATKGVALMISEYARQAASSNPSALKQEGNLE